jgi:hypothetical protein
MVLLERGGAGSTGSDCNNIFSSSDGKKWTMERNRLYGNWIQHENLIGFNGLIWMLAGSCKSDGVSYNISQWSADGGATWTADRGGYGARNGAVAEVFNNKLFIISGQVNDNGGDVQPVLNDVWAAGICGTAVHPAAAGKPVSSTAK